MGRGSEQTFFQRRHTHVQQIHEKMFNITNQGNADQHCNDITAHLLEWLLSNREEITSVGKDIEKREPSCTVDRNVNWYSHYGEQYGGSLKN